MNALAVSRDIAFHGSRLALGAMILIPTIALLCTPWPYLAVVPGLAAFAIPIFASRPQWVFAAILLMIPFGAFRGPLQKILAFGLIAFIGLQIIRDRRLPEEWKSHLWPLLFAFFAVNVLSALLSDYRSSSIENLNLLVTALLFFALGLRYMGGQDFVLKLPVIIGLSVSVSAGLAILGYIFDIKPFLDPSEHFKRGLGGSGSAPSLAGLVIFAMPFLQYNLTQSRKRSMQLVWFLLLLVSLGGLVTTYSRGGALVCGGWLAWVMVKGLVKIPPRKLGLVLSGGAVFAVLVASVIPPSYWERQMSLTNPEDRSVGRRATYLQVAAGAVAEHPVLGNGPGAFRKIYGQTTWSLHFQGALQKSLERYAHNSYVEVVVGSGFIGLGLFLMILARSLWDLTWARREALNADDLRLAPLITAARAALFILLLYLMIYSSVYDKSLWVGLALSQVLFIKIRNLDAAA